MMPGRALLAALSLALLTACMHQGRPLTGDNPFTTSTERPNQIRLEVRNLNFQDARLYALSQSGGRTRIGTVTGKQDASFDLPWRVNDELRIEIDLLAGPTCTTERLQVQPGDILELQIQSVFMASSFCR